MHTMKYGFPVIAHKLHLSYFYSFAVKLLAHRQNKATGETVSDSHWFGV